MLQTWYNDLKMIFAVLGQCSTIVAVTTLIAIRILWSGYAFENVVDQPFCGSYLAKEILHICYKHLKQRDLFTSSMKLSMTLSICNNAFTRHVGQGDIHRRILKTNSQFHSTIGKNCTQALPLNLAIMQVSNHSQSCLSHCNSHHCPDLSAPLFVWNSDWYRIAWARQMFAASMRLSL